MRSRRRFRHDELVPAIWEHLPRRAGGGWGAAGGGCRLLIGKLRLQRRGGRIRRLAGLEGSEAAWPTLRKVTAGAVKEWTRNVLPADVALESTRLSGRPCQLMPSGAMGWRERNRVPCQARRRAQGGRRGTTTLHGRRSSKRSSSKGRRSTVSRAGGAGLEVDRDNRVARGVAMTTIPDRMRR